MKLQNIAIDSCKLRIETRFINFTELGRERLLQQSAVQKIDSIAPDEVEFKNHAYKDPTLYEKGISLHFLVTRQSQGFAGTGESIEMLEILVNSKLLKKDYFLGINKKTIPKIINKINKIGLVELDEETFINNSYITDIDVKADLYGLSSLENEIFLEQFKHFSKESGNLTKTKKALMLQYSYRANSRNYISKPFVKFYDKNKELWGNSKTFRENYLVDENGKILDSKNNIIYDKNSILRLEGQIKNKRHLVSLLKAIKKPLKDPNKLNTFLSLNESDLHEILKVMLQKYISKNIGKNFLEINKDLSTFENCTLDSIRNFIKNGGTIEEFIYRYTNHLELELRMKQKRERDKIMDLYEKYISNDKAYFESNSFNKILSLFFS